MNVPFEVGSILGHKYRIDQVLGVGGMGYVLAATHIRLNERVAIKLLRPNICADSDMASRFLQEARAAAKIRGEHIVRVRDTDILDDGTPYLVMEYLEGHDLECLVQGRGAMPIALAVEFVLQVCQALAEAHFVGIVHRDIKPANIFLTERPDGSALIKVLDFGISKTISDSDGSVNLTKTAEIRGSPLFMSPEQMRRPREVDGRSDVWSLGVTLFYLLSGSFPFLSDNTLDLCLMVLQDEPVLLRAKRADAPLGLERVIVRCLQKKPGDRYANVADLAADLAEFGPPGAQSLAEKVARILSGNTTRRGGRPAGISGEEEGRMSLIPAPAKPVADGGTTRTLAYAKPVDDVPMAGEVLRGRAGNETVTTPYEARKPWRGHRYLLISALLSGLVSALIVLWIAWPDEAPAEAPVAASAQPSALVVVAAPVESPVEVKPVISASEQAMEIPEPVLSAGVERDAGQPPDAGRRVETVKKSVTETSKTKIWK